MATTYKLYWTRQDGQGFLTMGEFPDAREAQAAQPEALEQLLEQSNDDAGKDETRAGTWSICWTAERIDSCGEILEERHCMRLRPSGVWM